MGWRNQLRSARFRNAFCKVAGHSADLAGRRAQVHEYPSRDIPLVEDLGAKSREFSLEAYVVGDFCMARDALIAACNEAGAGTLMHPCLGARQVVCTGCQVTEKSGEGRVACLSLTFVEAGENRCPSVSDDLMGQLIAEDDATTKAITECFIDLFTVLNCPAFVLGAGQEKLSALMNQAQGFTDNPVPGNYFPYCRLRQP